jgi:hypothetical protein
MPGRDLHAPGFGAKIRKLTRESAVVSQVHPNPFIGAEHHQPLAWLVGAVSAAQAGQSSTMPCVPSTRTVHVEAPLKSSATSLASAALPEAEVPVVVAQLR